MRVTFGRKRESIRFPRTLRSSYFLSFSSILTFARFSFSPNVIRFLHLSVYFLSSLFLSRGHVTYCSDHWLAHPPPTLGTHPIRNGLEIPSTFAKALSVQLSSIFLCFPTLQCWRYFPLRRNSSTLRLFAQQVSVAIYTTSPPPPHLIPSPFASLRNHRTPTDSVADD